MNWMQDGYTKAVGSIECPRCHRPAGKQCTPTSSVVHRERRRAAIEQGLWDPAQAQTTDPDAPFYAAGSPLEALREY
jgi:hypothetical protein